MTTTDTQAPTIDGYDVVAPIGAGAHSTVWIVRDGDGTRHAAKVLRVGDGPDDREQRLLRRLDHDHVLTLRDTVRLADGRVALVLELAEGGSLARCLRQRRTLTPGELVTVLTPIARTLHDLHGAGLVHADLSPSNLLFTAAGKPLLADLGVSRVGGAGSEQLWATERWAAPEVLDGHAPTPAADVHALGAIAWAAVVGQEPPPAHSRPDLDDVAPHAPEALRRLVQEAMAHDPQDRPSAGQFALRLWDLAEPEPVPVPGLDGDDTPRPELTRRVIREQREDAAPAAPTPTERLRAAVSAHRARRGAAALALAAVLLLGGLQVADGVAAEPTVGKVTASTNSPASPGSPAASASPARTGGVPTSPPRTDPAAAVDRILQLRAAAWNNRAPDAAARYTAPGSPARTAEQKALRSLRATGTDYHGIGFDLVRTTVRPGAGEQVAVRATVRRSSYSTGERTEPARTERVELVLQRTDTGWALHSWRPVQG